MGPRKFFLDWLRVFAFAVLVLFHVGMLYVTWPYNLKSPRLFPGLEWWMEATSPWRMALLFLISGVACRFLIEKLGPRRFALNRLARLGVVVLTAVLVVNPVQVWVQLLSQGDMAMAYLEFWSTSYLTGDATLVAALGRPMPTWDHLWFVVYLLFYTLLFAAALALRSRFIRSDKPPLWVLLVVPALWMGLTDVLIGTIAPFTHALVNDWAAHLKWLGLFFAGAMLAGRHQFWITVCEYRHMLAAASLLLLVLYLGSRYQVLRFHGELLWVVLYRSTQGLFGWLVVLTLSGFAAHYLNKPSASLTYLNDAVLPVYVLHQPVLLAAAFLLFPVQLPIAAEIACLLVATALGPLAIYHSCIRPYGPMRFAFGLKTQNSSAS